MTNHDLKVAMLKDKGLVVPEGEHLGGDGKGNRLLFTGGEVNLGKVLEFLDRTNHRSGDVVDVELDRFPAGHVQSFRP